MYLSLRQKETGRGQEATDARGLGAGRRAASGGANRLRPGRAGRRLEGVLTRVQAAAVRLREDQRPDLHAQLRQQEWATAGGAALRHVQRRYPAVRGLLPDHQHGWQPDQPEADLQDHGTVLPARRRAWWPALLGARRQHDRDRRDGRHDGTGQHRARGRQYVARLHQRLAEIHREECGWQLLRQVRRVPDRQRRRTDHRRLERHPVLAEVVRILPALVLLAALAGCSAASPSGGAPTDLTATVKDANGIQFTWTDHASDEEGYLLEVRPAASPAFTVADVLDRDINSCGLVTLPNEKHAWYRVRPFYYGAQSNVVHASIG